MQYTPWISFSRKYWAFTKYFATELNTVILIDNDNRKLEFLTYSNIAPNAWCFEYLYFSRNCSWNGSENFPISLKSILEWYTDQKCSITLLTTWFSILKICYPLPTRRIKKKTVRTLKSYNQSAVTRCSWEGTPQMEKAREELVLSESFSFS